MNSKQLKNLPVLSIADGEQMGTVARAYLDVAARRVVGFALHKKTGFLETQFEPKIDAQNVHTLGSGGLMLNDQTAAHGEHIEERYAQLTHLDELSSRQMLTEGGVAIGHVVSVDFDDKTLGLTRIEAAAGLFKSNTVVAIGDVVTIGPEYVIVASVVADDDYVPAATADGGVPAGSRRVRWVEAEPETA